ncbi:hypothetical protein [Pedobacter sp. ASV28]|uniref:hypothetical protein n=1 Tax=Pedobacter sp. ASV28 TaxID=2795123 RepID=UPI0018EB5233|nr:hypothetical protein [Pedobacter sp. ASV28]
MNLSCKIFHWTDEIIHPKTLNNSQITNDDLLKLENGFLKQLKQDADLVFYSGNFSRKRTLAQVRQMIVMSNTIYGYLFRLSPTWKRKTCPPQLRQTYLHFLFAIEKIIGKAEQIIPELYIEIPLTNYGLSLRKMQIREAVKKLSIALNHLAIDKRLYELVIRDFYLFIGKKEITRYEYDYTINLIKEIVSSNVANTFGLIKMLYQHGFNPKGFFSYYANELDKKLIGISDLHDQLQIVISEQDIFFGLPESNQKMFISQLPIEDQFKIFLSQKERHLKETINIRRALNLEEQGSKQKNRLKIFLSVPQLSLLIRLFIEKGLLPKENIGELFAFFASHFSTPQTSLISAESLRKKSTDVEFSTAQKLKSHIIGMLNWLNENYNLSNFKGS